MAAPASTHVTANERFKAGFTSWFWGGLILATLAHALLFALTPQFGVEDVGYSSSDVAVIDIPDEIEIPAPPQDIARPPTPVIAETDFDADLTIPLTTFDANPVESLPPPPSQAQGEDLSAAPTFTPMTVRPRLQNQQEVLMALSRHYPPLLRDAGIGGVARVWFFIDETGRVVRTLIHETSGYDDLDQAALKVASMMRFTPGYNRDRPVPVWVSIEVTFEVDMS